MPGQDPTPPPEEPRLAMDNDDFTTARIKQQLAEAQERFADQLCDAFNTLVLAQARMSESTLGTLSVVQMDELMDCLRQTVTTPPPEFHKAVMAYDADKAPKPPEGA